MTDRERGEKACLRERLKKIRAAIPDRAVKEALIRERLERLSRAAQTIFVYLSIGSEADTRGFIRNNRHKTILVPFTVDGAIRPFRLIGENLEADRLGNPAVSELGQAYTGRVDLAVVPLLGFCGTYRIGYGSGCYDRFLRARPVPTIGLGFAECACRFTPEPHDVPLDAIVTQSGIIRGSGGADEITEE